ncbi:arginine--tRNA ligase [Helicobacter sp. MIT 21-1697]|uniref:arginine--tRNA ligase n=1 Tax=Helicobacter sp. MIT 21-1697 TaxID=2993733 RepID=UPI00224AD225|nr:arginine--tRNA ligase [Helicobacter sp. MIT 21-1697]MCX2716152.1 arginine--tRNA ligase [Helicobacter sp. MIT 21-1697]
MHHHIKALLQSALHIENTIDIVLEKPKNKDLGHFATPLAFNLAKIQKTNPKLIAEEIANTLANHTEFEKVQALNGFVNLTLSTTFLQHIAQKQMQHFMSFEADSISSNTLQDTHHIHTPKERILLEFVSANPTGPLHIGHARGAVYGDALARIGRFLGYEICTEYYINDAGAQIDMLGLSIFLAGKEHILKTQVEYPQSYYKGEYIIDLAKQCAQHFGEDVFKSEDSISSLAEFGKNMILQEIKENLAQVGISFDCFVSEKSLYDRWQDTLNTLKSHQGIYTKEGKIWIASSQINDEKDRVIVRENGEPTYLAGDIIYHQDKFHRPFEHYINIWGADHHGYIARVKAAIHFLGYDENKLEVLLSQMVSLLKGGQPYKMSKRAGNFILMKDVVEDIGSDALRFIFLSKKPDTHLEFDVDDLKKEDASNPIYYINYANARIYTLFDKSGISMHDIAHTFTQLNINEQAKALLFEALCLKQVIESSFRDREIQKICEYLKSLCASFHSFYNAHKILQSPNEKSLLYVLMIVSQSITLGLSLLGICAKTKM